MEKDFEHANVSAYTNIRAFHHDVINAVAVELPASLNLSPGNEINFNSPLQIKWKYAIKATIDVIVSTLLIITLLSWLIPILSILIKLDSKGPVFFLQKRSRQGGKYFTCIKFRSMIVNDYADILCAAEDDERITKFGRFMRRYHIDELPQLFNVLIGEMSLIGPRPYMINENMRYELLLPKYTFRYAVKPGITGLAQSRGHFGSINNLEMARERVTLDLQYVDEWSLRMDIKIIYRTLRMIITKGFTNKK
jgi:putative colanic acid biosysnthesis UDP-glucose lipid carrier transferase